MKSLRIAKTRHRELVSTRTGERFSRSAVLSELLGITSMFVHHDVIPPGRRASGRHFHTERDELVVVLAGEIHYERNGRTARAKSGEVVAFPRGPAGVHAIENRGRRSARVLVIANPAERDVVVHEERVARRR